MRCLLLLIVHAYLMVDERVPKILAEPKLIILTQSNSHTHLYTKIFSNKRAMIIVGLG